MVLVWFIAYLMIQITRLLEMGCLWNKILTEVREASSTFFFPLLIVSFNYLCSALPQAGIGIVGH